MPAPLSSPTAIAVSLLSVSSHALRQRPSSPSLHLKVPDGFTIERIAGPELLSYPMFAVHDDRGRLFVFESTEPNTMTTEEMLAQAVVPRPHARGRGRRRLARPQRDLRRQAAVPEGRRVRRRQPLRFGRAASAPPEGHRRRRGGRRARDCRDGLDVERERRRARWSLPGSRRLAVPHRLVSWLPDHAQGRRHPRGQGGPHLAAASGWHRPRVDCWWRLRQCHRARVHALGRYHRHDDLLHRPARRRP